MSDMKVDLIRHIEGVAWDDSCDAETKLARIQDLLYQNEQNQSAGEYEWENDLTPEEMGLPEGFRR